MNFIASVFTGALTVITPPPSDVQHEAFKAFFNGTSVKNVLYVNNASQPVDEKSFPPAKETPLSLTLAQNFVDFIYSFDPDLKLIKPEDFNVDHLPQDTKERKDVFENFYKWYFASIFEPGSNLYDLADKVLRGEWGGDAPLKTARLARDHAVVKEYNDFGDMRAAALVFMKSVGIAGLSADDYVFLEAALKENKEAINALLSDMTMAPALLGKKAGLEIFLNQAESMNSLFQSIFEQMGFNFVDPNAPLERDI